MAHTNTNIESGHWDNGPVASPSVVEMENAVAWVVCDGTRGKNAEMNERKSDIKVTRDTSPSRAEAKRSKGNGV